MTNDKINSRPARSWTFAPMFRGRRKHHARRASCPKNLQQLANRLRISRRSPPARHRRAARVAAGGYRPLVLEVLQEAAHGDFEDVARDRGCIAEKRSVAAGSERSINDEGREQRPGVPCDVPQPQGRIATPPPNAPCARAPPRRVAPLCEKRARRLAPLSMPHLLPNFFPCPKGARKNKTCKRLTRQACL